MSAEAPLDLPADTPAARAPSLRDALRRARVESAERSGVLVELRTTELARLDLLKDELAPIFAQVPQNVDLFDAAILPGDPARLFVDVLGFVEMGRDKRTYRFFQDTRHGRRLIAETSGIEEIVQAITDYVARRLVEREKALAADTIPVGAPGKAEAKKAPDAGPNAGPDAGRNAPAREKKSAGWGALFLIALLVALAAYIGWAPLWALIAG